jgi:general secretion pathway protein M
MKAAVATSLNSLRTRWQAMPLRDQRALAALTAFAVLLALWVALIAPLHNFAGSSQTAYAQAQTDLAWMQANACTARQAGATQGRLAEGQSLLSAVNASARESGLNLQRFEPDGDARVRVTLENAVFTDVMRWIVVLQNRYGLAIESFHADQQAQPGVVNIRMTVGRSS